MASRAFPGLTTITTPSHTVINYLPVWFLTGVVWEQGWYRLGSFLQCLALLEPEDA